MHIEHLVKMVNQIGGFFEAMPDREEAQAGVAQHLRSYWAPRMRKQLMAHVAGDGDGLSPFTLEALRLHEVALTPAA